MNAPKTKPTYRRILLGVAGCLLAGVVFLSLLARQTSVAHWLEVYAGIENDSYKVYPTASAAQDFYGRVYAKIRTQPIIPQTAETPQDASALVGFQVLSPQRLPEGFEPLSRYEIYGEHAYEIAIHTDEARRILGSAGLPTAALPVEPAIDKINVDIPASVIVHQSQGERWFTMIQGAEGQVSLPEGADPAALQALNELGLRYLGLPEAAARQLSQEMGWAAFLVAPPADMFHAEQASVNGAPALVLYQSQTGSGLQAVIWKVDGVLYGIYGGLPVEELVKMAESMN